MTESVKSNLRLFTDDTIMWPTISNQSDCHALPQSDLSKLELRESEWFMAFYPDKCEVIRITHTHARTHAQNNVLFGYKISGLTLQERMQKT